MDGSRFDAWTRRRFGFAAGSLAGSIFGLVGLAPDDAAAKKGKKKRRCRRVGQGCRPSGKRKKCCKDLLCQSIEARDGANLCCKALNEPCSLTTDECCSGICTGQCICKTVGTNCTFDANCCSLSCVSGQCSALE